MIIVFGTLLAGVLYDRVEQSPNVVDVVAETAPVVPSLRVDAPIASTWFCPVGSSVEGGYADVTISITNASEEPAVANLDIQTEAGPGAGLRVALEPLATELVALSALSQNEAAGVVVEVVGGEGVVGHQVVTPFGNAEGPCATESASSWYFADGATTRDTGNFLALMNPFPDDVSFNVAFQTSSRTREPIDLQSAVVPARSVRVIDVSEFVAREANVATTIETIQGQLVVERLLTADGSLGPIGAALQLGVVAPAPRWSIPAGRIHEGADDVVTVFNPSDEAAAVDVQLDPALTSDRASFGLVPIELTVPPGRITTLDLAAAAEARGLPLPYELGITVISVNDVPVVAERTQRSPGIDTSLIGAGGTSAKVDPARRQDGSDQEIPVEDDGGLGPLDPGYVQRTAVSGLTTSRGVEIMSTRWLSPWATMLPDDGTAIVVTSVEGALVEVRQILGGALSPPLRGAVDPEGRTIITLPAPVAGAPLVLTADAPVSAEIVIVSGDRHDVVAMIPVLEPPAAEAADEEGES